MPSSIKRSLMVVAAASLAAAFIGVGHAQSQAQGGLRWAKAAPFPEPEEELYGAVANGKRISDAAVVGQVQAIFDQDWQAQAALAANQPVPPATPRAETGGPSARTLVIGLGVAVVAIAAILMFTMPRAVPPTAIQPTPSAEPAEATETRFLLTSINAAAAFTVVAGIAGQIK